MLHHVKKIPVILLAAFLLLTLFAFQAQAAPTTTSGGLLHYSSQAEFETAFPGLPVEDFEESTIGDAAGAAMPRPLNSTTTNAYFAPGDILPGLTITATGTGTPGGELVAIGGSFGGWNNTSKAVSNNNYSNVFTIDFSTSTTYTVGMDVFLINLASGNIDLEVYTTGDTLIETISLALGSAAPDFVGIHSPIHQITKITIVANPNSHWTGVDNIQFGGGVTFYTSQAAFESANPGLPVEDFEESPIADSSFLFVPEPLDSSTNIPGSFITGDIQPGLAIGTVSQPGGSPIGIVGANGIYGNQSVVIAQQSRVFDLTLSFTNYDAYAVGMDLMYSATNDALIIIYGYNNVILGMTTVTIPTTETFFGVYSNQPITKIAVINNSDFEFVDNIQFGGSPMGLTFYTDLTSLGSLKNEDFSESTVVSPTGTGCDEPLDSSTNNACFSPGDIVTGISFQSLESTSCPDCLRVYPSGTFTGATELLIAPSDNLRIDFSGSVKKVGTHIYNNAYMAYIYDLNGSLLGASYVPAYQSTGGYWGVSSDKPIGKLVLGQNNQTILLDSIMFGSKFPWAMFIPKKKLPNP